MTWWSGSSGYRFPRMRGDEPDLGVGIDVELAFSPHARG